MVKKGNNFAIYEDKSTILVSFVATVILHIRLQFLPNSSINGWEVTKNLHVANLTLLISVPVFEI